MKIVSKLFSGLVSIQVILFIFFMLENINTLDNITFYFNLGSSSFSFSLNVYTAFIFIGLIFAVVLLAGIQVFGGGLNSQGTRTMSKYMGLVSLYIVLGIGSSYYVLALSKIGLIIALLITLVYVVQGINLLMSDADNVYD